MGDVLFSVYLFLKETNEAGYSSLMRLNMQRTLDQVYYYKLILLASRYVLFLLV